MATLKININNLKVDLQIWEEMDDGGNHGGILFAKCGAGVKEDYFATSFRCGGLVIWKYNIYESTVQCNQV